MEKNKWYANGIRFECQGSGKCCSSRGEYGFVYLTKSDREAMANELNLSLDDFIKQYCKTQGKGVYYLKSEDSPDCIFLNKNKCKIYAARPMQCKTWPFWPESMDAKTWKKEIASFCPGVGKGKLHSQSEIDKIVTEQLLSEVE